MKYISYIALLFCVISCQKQQDSVFQWRGENRDGIYNEGELLKSWQANEPKLLWFTEEIGNGYGSPVITDDKVIINGEIDSISHLFAFDLTGKLLWKTPNGNEFVGNGYSQNFPGVRSTPTVFNDLVYTCSGNGRVACIETQTGKEKWALNMGSDLHGIQNEFGYSESLLVDGDNLYCYPGGTDTNVVALNRLTGKVIWASKALSDTVAFASPMMIKLPTRNILVTFSGTSLFGIDTKSGEMLWSHKQDTTQFKEQCNTPVYADGFIYYVAGDGNGAVKLELSADGASIKEIWRNAAMKNALGGFVKLGNYIYSPDQTQKLKAIDVNTGALADTLKMNRGAIIAADSMLYVYSQSGDVSLVKYDGSKMELAGSLKIEKGTKEHFSHPVISKGVLYVRHGKALVAYDIKAK